MTPEQAGILRTEVEEITRRTRELIAGLDEARLMRRPPDGGWSIAENLQHLALTADAMIPLADAALIPLEREQKKSRGPAGLGFLGWLLYKSLEPPARMRIKTTKPFEPVAVRDPLVLAEDLRERDERLRALIDRAQGLDTTSVRVVSPFNKNAKYNLYAAFRIMLSHARRHLWQAERVKAVV